jgi:hypothetical protein
MLIFNAINLRKELITIEIEFNDHSFTHKWKDYYQRTLKRCLNLDWYCNIMNRSERTFTLDECIPHLDKIKNALEFFDSYLDDDVSKELEIINLVLSDINILQQQHLNLWHRSFTRLAVKYFHPKSIVPNGLDKKIVHSIIHDINTNTHQLERYTYADLPRRSRLFDKTQIQYTAQCTDGYNLKYITNKLWDEGYIEEITPRGFDFNTCEYNYSVWLQEDIQGKDQFKAWLDYDDLTENDITGNLFMTPNLVLDPNYTYSRILDNDEFRNESILSKKTIDRYPLGNIINIDSIDWANLPGSTILEIILDSKLLYKLP